MIYNILYLIFFFILLFDFVYLIRYYDMKIILFWILAKKNNIKNIKYINELNIDEIKQILQLKTKGKFIEYYIATPAWKPIISLESCDNKEWISLKNNFIFFISKIKKDYNQLYNIIDEIIETYVKQNKMIYSCTISKIVCMAFCNFLFNYNLSEYELDILYKSSIEWRKEISLKGKGNIEIKLEAINIILQIIKKTKNIYDIFEDKWNNPHYYSIIMQPFIISPMINISDIMVNYQVLINNKKILINNEITQDLIDKIIYSYHPFPILERYDIIKNTQYFIPLDVLTNYENYNNNTKILSFGYGPRKCAGSQYTYKIMEILLKKYQKNIYLFDLIKNHKYSGRINDKFNLYESIYMLYKLFCIIFF